MSPRPVFLRRLGCPERGVRPASADAADCARHPERCTGTAARPCTLAGLAADSLSLEDFALDGYWTLMAHPCWNGSDCAAATALPAR